MASVTTKILNSLGWVFSNMVAVNAIEFVRTAVLWYFLTEGDFGLNSMTWLVISSLNLLTDMGFTQALVQRRTDMREAITVAWYANIVIHGAVYGVIALSAPLAAMHFGEPELESLLRVTALTVLIRCAGTTNFALMRKHFEFRSILVADGAEVVVRTVAQIALAAAGAGVWGLVYGNMIGVATQSAVLCWLHPIRIGRFDFRVAREMFHFGKHMTISTVCIWLIKNMDYYFVGKFLGKSTLGFYTQAFRLAHMIATNVTRMLGSVLFPAFAEVGHDAARARGAWFKASRYSMVLIMPMGIGLMVFAPEVILGFFPAKCEVVIAPMVILTVFALCRALGTTLSDLAKGVGKPYVLTQAAFWHMVLMVPILYAAVNLVPWSLAAATRLGGLDITASSLLGFLATLAEQRISLVAVSVGVSGTAIFAIGLTFQLCAREVQITPRYVFESLRPALAAGLAMALAGLAARELVYLVVHPNRLGRMVALVVAGGVSCAAYGAWLWFRSPEVVSDLRKMLERRRAEGGRKKAAKNPPAPVA